LIEKTCKLLIRRYPVINGYGSFPGLWP